MAQDTKNKQAEDPPKRRNWVEPVAPSVTSAAAQAFARAGFADMTLVLRWDEIVGPEVARLARPIKLAAGADGSTLSLKCEPGAALFLQHESRTLIGRINAYLGREAISRIRFVQGPLLTRQVAAVRVSQKIQAAPNDPARRYNGPEGLKNALLSLAGRRRP